VKNIDDSLDMLCIIRHGNTDPIEQISEKFNLFVPAILRIRKGNVEFLYHLPRASSENRDMRLFLDKFGARDSGDFFTMLVTSNFYPAIGSLNRLFFSWFDRWIVQYFLTLKILYIDWNVRMNEGKRWKLLVDDL
jgi:hypothetical protein